MRNINKNKDRKILKVILELYQTFSLKNQKLTKLVLLVIGINAIVSTLTVISAAPFISIISNPEIITNNKFVQEFIINPFDLNNREVVFIFGLFFGIVSLTSAGIKIAEYYLITWFSSKVGTSLSIDIYKTSLFKSYAFHIENNPSKIVASATKFVDQSVQLLNSIFNIFSGFVSSLCIIISLLIYAFIPSLTAIITFFLVYVLLIKYFKSTISNLSKQCSYSTKKQVQLLQESLNGIRDIIISSNQLFYIKKYKNLDIDVRTKQAKILFIGSFPREIIELTSIIFLIAITLRLFYTNNSANLITTVGIIALGSQKLMPNMQKIYNNWVIFSYAKEPLLNILEFIDKSIYTRSDIKNKTNIKFFNSLSLSKISFKYPSAKKVSLRDINMEVKRGEKVGIIGNTGEGKSTILDISMGLMIPSTGNVFINKLDLHGSKNDELLKAWRSSIYCVPQTIYLADMSIAENIAIGIDKQNIDWDLLIECAKKAQIHKFITSRLDKYETLVGEKGVKLSGGQRQRIGIARALYKRPRVLFLDEATSSLDDKTEENVMRGILENSSGLTIVSIAHRLSSLKNFDRIYKVKNGRLE